MMCIAVMSMAFGTTTPARASDAHGYCHLRVDITITATTKLKSVTKTPTGSPAYDIRVWSYDPTGMPGDTPKECLVPNNVWGDPFPETPFVETGVWAERQYGAADSLTCEYLETWGGWSQSWSGAGPDPVAAVYTITGTWGNWLLDGNDGFLFEMAMPLTFANPADAHTLLPRCSDASSGVAKLSLVGVQTFVDG